MNKIEKILEKQNQDTALQLEKHNTKNKNRENIENFMLERESHGLTVSSKHGKFWALCKICNRHENKILKCSYYDAEWVSSLKSMILSSLSV